jgi:hypothetical protein
MWGKGGMLESPDPFMGEGKGEWHVEPFGHDVDSGLVKEKRARLKRCDQRVYVIEQFLLSDRVCLIKDLMDKAR